MQGGEYPDLTVQRLDRGSLRRVEHALVGSRPALLRRQHHRRLVSVTVGNVEPERLERLVRVPQQRKQVPVRIDACNQQAGDFVTPVVRQYRDDEIDDGAAVASIDRDVQVGHHDPPGHARTPDPELQLLREHDGTARSVNRQPVDRE
jgi:hypothetical protein